MALTRLPTLSCQPQLYPHCDTSLSSTLLYVLSSILPSCPSLTLSIGSGHGLLEALLCYRYPDVLVHSVEVAYKIPQYHATNRLTFVSSTSSIWEGAKDAKAWLFVYPKDLSLVERYIERYGSGQVQIVVWIGPRNDLKDIEVGFNDVEWAKEVVEEAGLKEYEMLVVWRKRSTK